MTTNFEDTCSLLKRSCERSEKPVEIFYLKSNNLEIGSFEGNIDSFSRSESSGIGIRLVDSRRLGTSYTEDCSPEGITAAMNRAAENARYTEEDNGNVLYEESIRISSDAWSGNGGGQPLKRKKQVALDLEAEARAFDARIVNVPHAYYMEEHVEKAVINSHGVFCTHGLTLYSTLTYVTASADGQTKIGACHRVYPRFSDIKPEETAQEAARKALDLLGSREVSSRKSPVVLSPETASFLLEAFICSEASPFFGENILKGYSRLEGKMGKAIGSSLFTLEDDPEAFSPRSCLFDDEGVPTKKQTLVGEGIFISPFHNLYSAARMAADPNGFGRRSSYKSGTATGVYLPYIPNGEKSEGDLVKALDNGFFITSLEGLHEGLDHVSGDFSVAASGFLVEKGEAAYPVENITIAGNMFDIFFRIRDKGNDRLHSAWTSFSSPSLLIEELAISGI